MVLRKDCQRGELPVKGVTLIAPPTKIEAGTGDPAGIIAVLP
jgi:kynurenine formamidase